MPDQTRVTVSNTDPLITLEHLPGGFDLLKQLYDILFIPPQVLAELTRVIPVGKDYLFFFGLQDFVVIEEVTTTDPALNVLDSGEKYAIALALKKSSRS